eukprot:Em0015g1127a
MGSIIVPLPFKIFNENSHIVAIRTTGNVYSHEAVERLNVKAKNFRDLLTDEPFQKSDIITLQDPTDLEKFDISSFHHIKNNLTIDEDEVESVKKDPTYFLRSLNPETRTTLEELYRDYKEPEKKSETKEKLTTRNASSAEEVPLFPSWCFITWCGHRGRLQKNQDNFAAALYCDVVGCRPKEDGLTYSKYLHLVSHYHRVTESLNYELKSATGDLEDTRLKVFLKPLFKQVAQYPLLSITDRLICQSAINSIEGAITTDYADQLKCFESILGEQRQLFGSRSLSVAQTLTEMADQKYSMQDLNGAKQLLEEAVSVHKYLQSTPAGRNKHFLDYGLTLSSLGIVCSTMGEHQLSKSYLEQALATYQTLPDDGSITKRQRKLVASTLIDLSHAYLALGQLVVAKKHVELAVDAPGLCTERSTLS